MKLLADSGSTKTDWCIVHHGECIKRFQSLGMNPYFQSPDELLSELQQTVLPQLDSQSVHNIYFYGAGCNAVKSPLIAELLQRCFPQATHIEVASDLLGAARSLCGHERGIACILGTGSNSCYFDGQQIVDNVSPLGFILGDEGSGAHLGKQLVGDLLKGQLPSSLKDEFLHTFQLTPTDIIERVYRQPFPNRFLASLSPFIAAHLSQPEVHALVYRSFQSFIQRNVRQYSGHTDLPIHFTGSISKHYQSVLQEVITSEGLHMGKIKASPMEGLIEYHQ